MRFHTKFFPQNSTFFHVILVKNSFTENSMLHARSQVFAWCVISSLFWISDVLAQNDTTAESIANRPFGSVTSDRLDFMNTETPWKTWGVVPVQTRHFNRQAVIDDHLSEDNPGLGIERSNGRWHWMAGAYRNSIRQTSVYGMLGYTPLAIDIPLNSTLALGAAAGLLTGYQNTQKGYPIVPAGGALLSWETPYHFGVNVFLVPTLSSFQVEGFVATQLKL